ncbi:MAG: hypothetical protein JXR97_10790 [Planctomycetes bacterium]|nr:hypothetical protein [Planctomycetota bacterium]
MLIGRSDTFGIMTAAVFCFSLLLSSTPAVAATVMELKFDETQNIPAADEKQKDQPARLLKMEGCPEKASPHAELLSDTTYNAGATGISDQWKAYLATGFVDVGASGSGKSDWYRNGLRSYRQDKKIRGFYEEYMGFAGFGNKEKNTGGCIMLVVSPHSDWIGGRHGLFGSGSNFGTSSSCGALNLWMEDGVLRFIAGRCEGIKRPGFSVPTKDLNGDGDTKDWIYSESTIVMRWKQDSWYFIAASWQDDAKPVLYVREVSPAGPLVSPVAIHGNVTPEEGNVLETIPAGATTPSSHPLSIGAYYANPGQDRFHFGAEARIAYARLDNAYLTYDEIESVFGSMGK